MKIVQVHNYYQQAGGEDAVVTAERDMLEEHGNIVVTFYKTNDDIQSGRGGVWGLGSKLFGLLSVSLNTIWNGKTYREFRKLLQKEQPEMVHCHNSFPLISPAIYWACAKEKVPVVQTLHNYRLLCLNAFLFREPQAVCSQVSALNKEGAKNRVPETNGAICELCVAKKLKISGIRYKCYRDSYAASCVVALMLYIHKLIGTWSKKVTAYIALTEFQKQKMVEGGLPADKIFVKPNFIAASDSVKNEGLGFKPDLYLNHLKLENGEPYALFVGRLSPEKGCDVLIRAWQLCCERWNVETGKYEPSTTNCQQPSTGNPPQLLIVGDGPERENLETLAISLKLSTVSFLGKKSKDEVLDLMRNSQFLVFPSVWYETFGLTVLEAGLSAAPSIVASPTTTSDMIEDGQTGQLFPIGDVPQLADKIRWAFAHPQDMAKMGQQARQVFESTYSSEMNYMELMGIYESMLKD